MPFEDRLNAGIVVEALNLQPSVNAQDLTASQRAATSGLITALQMARGGAGPVLVVAAEKRRTKTASPLELQTGDGAAAVLVGTGPVVAKLIASASRTVDFVDHFRGEGFEFDYTWEERWIRDEGYNKIVPAALADLFKATDVKPADIAHFAMPCVLPRVAAGIAKKAGMPDARRARQPARRVRRDRRGASARDAGATRWSAPSPATRSWWSASARAAMRCCSRRPSNLAKLAPRLGVKGHLARRKEETNYAKFLSFNDLVAIERGMRAEVDKATPLSSLYRNRRMLTGFIGGQCRKCGTLQFPKSKVCVNPNCNAFHSQDDHPFADMPSKVQSYTADRLTYSPDPPHYYGMVVFEEGGRADDRLHRRRCGKRRRGGAHAHDVPHQGLRSPARLHALLSGKRRRPGKASLSIGSWIRGSDMQRESDTDKENHTWPPASETRSRSSAWAAPSSASAGTRRPTT